MDCASETKLPGKRAIRHDARASDCSGSITRSRFVLVRADPAECTEINDCGGVKLSGDQLYKNLGRFVQIAQDRSIRPVVPGIRELPTCFKPSTSAHSAHSP